MGTTHHDRRSSSACSWPHGWQTVCPYAARFLPTPFTWHRVHHMLRFLGMANISSWLGLLSETNWQNVRMSGCSRICGAMFLEQYETEQCERKPQIDEQWHSRSLFHFIIIALKLDFVKLDYSVTPDRVCKCLILRGICGYCTNCSFNVRRGRGCFRTKEWLVDAIVRKSL